MLMDKAATLVIGGGASGISAAISARRKGDSVLICEKLPQLGKKLLISGNGRCNLLNEDLSESHYNERARRLVKSVFSRFGKDDIVDFFNDLGLEIYARDGRVFPMTNQAPSVLKVLEMELARLSVASDFGFEAVSITDSEGGFVVRSKAGLLRKADKVIIACGGKSYPALGSDGSSYVLAGQFGHRAVGPVPSAVPLVVKNNLCHVLQGQKIFAAVRSLIVGKVAAEASGEVLFTKYGLSGTAILDISESVSIAVNRHRKKDVVVAVDLAPFMDKEELGFELARRRGKNYSAHEFFAGILPNKFGPVFADLALKGQVDDMVMGLKDKRFAVAGTRGWNEAEFTSGGIEVNEVNEGTLESKLKKGIYFAGEALDVGGVRGGYHLAWAWASGFAAGLAR